MVSVGIDVSKGKSTVCALDQDGEILLPTHEFQHSEADVTLLIERIKQLPEPRRVVLENTGYYHWPVVNKLMEAGEFVCVVNSILTSRFARQRLHRGKTDPLDAMMLSEYGLANWRELKSCFNKDEDREILRILSREYEHAVHIMINQKVHVFELLDKVMPGITTALKDKNGKSKLSDFTLEFWHFEQIRAYTQEEFTELYCKWANEKGYRKNESKAAEIHSLSQNGIPTLPCSTPVKMIVQEAARQLKSIEESVECILAQMNELAKSLPEFKVVSDMKGVGDRTTARLIAEIGDVRHFSSAKALVAYAGLDAPPYQSGAFESKDRHISKKGNKHLRKIGFEIMNSLNSTKPSEDNAVYLFIRKKRAEGKYYLSAYMAGLNKFLHIYYARVKAVLGCSEPVRP